MTFSEGPRTANRTPVRFIPSDDNPEMANFVDLTRKLMSVRKSEIDAERPNGKNGSH